MLELATTTLELLQRGGLDAALILAVLALLFERKRLIAERDVWVDRAWRLVTTTETAVRVVERKVRGNS